MARGIATSPEVRARIDELNAAGVSMPDIASQMDMPYFTVYDLLQPKVVAVAEAIDPTSTKGYALKAIITQGQFDTVMTLAAYLRRENDISVGGHELIHLLYSLNRDALVRFNEQKRGSQKDLVKIRPTAAARKLGRTNGHAPVLVAEGAPRHRSDRTDYRTHGVRAVGGPIERSHVEPDLPIHDPLGPIPIPAPETEPVGLTETPVAPTEPSDTRPPDDSPSPSAEQALDTPASVAPPPEGSWPELARLRERVAAMANRATRLDALVKAAESLRDIDANASQDLMKRAERVADETTTMTPLETEYLRYAASLASPEGHDDDTDRSG